MRRRIQITGVILLAAAVTLFWHSQRESAPELDGASLPLAAFAASPALPATGAGNTADFPASHLSAAQSAWPVPANTAPAPISRLETPRVAERPYVRLQITSDGSIQGVFDVKPAPAHQRRALRAEEGYYYSLTSDAGEILLDGVAPFPVIRVPSVATGNLIHCSTQRIDVPVFFDVPNTRGRLRVFTIDTSDLLSSVAQNKKPVVDVLLHPAN
jgi:hypothetical protein